MNDIIIIPDVHGRSFWKDAVNIYPDADTIFLGDYHDPYPSEGISCSKSLDNFIEIIEYAREHKNVHLLLGNHDLHYLVNFGEACRYDYANAAVIHGLLSENLDMVKLADLRTVEDKTVLFSHAPILTDWINEVGETDNVQLLVNRLNRMLINIDTKPWDSEDMLGHISHYRGGYLSFGSPIWADVREINNNNLIPTVDYSIFGHTQLKDAIITDRWAMLDCRKAFCLTSDFKITAI